ncbi:MAG TPA: SIR2 family protein [Tepidisphaeraceae bacterium]
MEDDVAASLLLAIEGERLVILSGAGLSMAAPSGVPSAKALLEECVKAYEEHTTTQVPATASADIEAFARWLRSKNEFSKYFINLLIPWPVFRRDPNAGHIAIADFLCTGVADYSVTANVDVLVEIAAEKLGEDDFRSDLRSIDLERTPEHKRLLKLHGCCLIEREFSIWCREQMADGPVQDRIKSFSTFLRANLPGKTLLVVGFWTDWAYLNQLLLEAVGNVEPQGVILVDPAEPDTLEGKAPELWKWANSRAAKFVHVKRSGADFLDELRAMYSRKFLTNLMNRSRDTFRALTGVALGAAPPLPTTLTSDDLYALRRDACGQPVGGIARVKRPGLQHELLGAMHLLMAHKGGTLDGSTYSLGGKRLRLVNGAGELMSKVKQRFMNEPPTPLKTDTTVCVGCHDDGGAVPHIIRGGGSGGIVRPVALGDWTSHEALLAP